MMTTSTRSTLARGRKGRTLLTAHAGLLGHRDGRHRLLREWRGGVRGWPDRLRRPRFSGEVARRIDFGNALIGPGFIDLDALSDLDTTILGIDNHPGWAKGRVWPRSYVERGPLRDVYAGGTGVPEALRLRPAALQRHHDRAADRLAVLSRMGRNGRRIRCRGRCRRRTRPARLSRPRLPLRRHGSGRAGPDRPQFRRGARPAGPQRRDRLHRAADGRAWRSGARPCWRPIGSRPARQALLRAPAAAARDLGVPVRLHMAQGTMEVDTVRASARHDGRRNGWRASAS